MLKILEAQDSYVVLQVHSSSDFYDGNQLMVQPFMFGYSKHTIAPLK